MKRTLLLLFALSFCVSLSAATPDRVEPLCWWTGMTTELQIMVHSSELARAKRVTVEPADKGISVTAIHKAESPNYLFIDVEVAPDAAAGRYKFRIKGTDTEFDYDILPRREGSALRRGFSSADMLYLLMPDRFANGDPTNDSTDDTAEKALRSHRDGRHGGDIKGITDHLDYLADLGVTALWSTPLLLDNEPWCSYHGYACADYYRIDPRYGTNELYRSMVDEAHNRDIKVVMDFVTNHCGTAHWWIADLPFANWINRWDEFTRSNYTMTAHSDPNASEWDLQHCVDGWFDRSMPDMNLRNPFLRRYFEQAAIWWIEWADLDGLRVDTFPYNDKESIALWTRTVLNEYPELTIVGECWFHEPAYIAYWDGRDVNNDGYTSNLPMVMDFPLTDAVWGALQLDHKAGWGEGMAKVYNTLAQDFLYPDARTLMIFLSNHDTMRSADCVGGSVEKMKLAITMLATMRGMPQLYVGDENLMRSDDLQGGDGAKRIDFDGGWEGDRCNLFTAEGRSAEQNEIFDHTRRLFRWRKSAEVIHHGSTLHFSTSDNTYVYFRYDEERKVMVVINAEREPMQLQWERYAEMLPDGVEGRELLTGSRVEVGRELTVAPMTSMVIEF